VPFVLVAAPLGLLWLPEPWRPGAPPLDLPGVALSTLALTGIVFALIDGVDAGWTSPAMLCAAAVSIAAGTTDTRSKRNRASRRGDHLKQARARDRTAGPGQTSQERVSRPETRVSVGAGSARSSQLLLWRSSAGADGAPVVEDQHSRTALLVLVRAGVYDAACDATPTARERKRGSGIERPRRHVKARELVALAAAALAQEASDRVVELVGSFDVADMTGVRQDDEP
jgi:hypothetical protein